MPDNTCVKRIWIIFSQTVTIAVAIWFVVATLQPEWLGRSSGSPGRISVVEAPAAAPSGPAAVGSLHTAVRKAAPAVVSITTTKLPERNSQSNDPWFRFFFGEPESRAQAGLGSGVILSPEGFIVTNNHVIDGADDIEIALPDGRRARAQVIGTDPDTDLAILRVDLVKLPVAVLGNSDQLQVGDQVLAIGNPFGVGQTVTSGIVSALGRNQLGINTFENFIQTDAAINPGNSGGALVDVHGHLMGINTAIYSRSGGSMGIGFAIPVSTVRFVLESIVRDGRVTRGWIGIEPNELTAEIAESFGIKIPNGSAMSGVIVTGVLQNGPAAQAGVRPGDVITRVAGQSVVNVAGLLSNVAALRPGETAKLQIVRQGVVQELPITPGVRPQTRRRER